MTIPVESLAQATSLYGSLIRTVEETRADPVASSDPAGSVFGGIILPQKTNAEMEVSRKFDRCMSGEPLPHNIRGTEHQPQSRCVIN